MNRPVKASVLAVVALIALVGCKEPGQGGLKRPRSIERPEYDCKKHAVDKICELPWKDKVVLYCHAGKIPRVVRYREECK